MSTTDSTSDPHPPPVPATGIRLREAVAACITRHRDGDREAMADLARLITPWLHLVIRPYRLGRESADDVVQSTLLAALLHVHELRDPVSGLSWLSVVARREALHVLQAERRYLPVDELPGPAGSAEGPEDIVLARMSQALVRRVVSMLPTRHRLLLERVAQADRPNYASISVELRMPLGSIGPTRRRGLERMRELLANDPEWNADVSA
jgi:DNA-directed RNA polymerase specialized sigma24 family protein